MTHFITKFSTTKCQINLKIVSSRLPSIRMSEMTIAAGTRTMSCPSKICWTVVVLLPSNKSMAGGAIQIGGDSFRFSRERSLERQIGHWNELS